MDKRKAWREQEQRLVERWNLAAERYRRVHEEISRLQAAAGGALSEDLAQKVQTARAEMEAVRREVARVKVEFNSGKRY
jgi:DNA repair exonuclease SbcCD ATPase subunit